MSHQEQIRQVKFSRAKRVAARMKAVYVTVAILFLNTLAVYLIINVLLGAAIGIRDALTSESKAATDPITSRYGPEVLDKVYPNMSQQDRKMLLGEAWNYRYEYSDYTHYQSRPHSGKYVNITDVGFRKSANQGPWPPATENLNLFVFGGSTTFGTGLPDDQTVPSYLQKALAQYTKRRVCVYNFGVGFYYSTQERLFLEKLLMEGYVPDAVFFIDGVNEGMHVGNRPWFSDEMAILFEKSSGAGQHTSTSTSYARSLADLLFFQPPIGRASRFAARKLSGSAQPALPTQPWDGEKSARQLCDVYLANKDLIECLGKRFDVTTVFVWQPSPAYNYDLKYHFFAPAPSLPPQELYHFRVMGEYYPMMREIYQSGKVKNLIWSADIQNGRTECLYCDRYHYTAAFAEDFAQQISSVVREQKMLDNHLREKAEN